MRPWVQSPGPYGPGIVACTRYPSSYNTWKLETGGLQVQIRSPVHSQFGEKGFSGNKFKGETGETQSAETHILSAP